MHLVLPMTLCSMMMYGRQPTLLSQTESLKHTGTDSERNEEIEKNLLVSFFSASTIKNAPHILYYLCSSLNDEIT